MENRRWCFSRLPLLRENCGGALPHEVPCTASGKEIFFHCNHDNLNLSLYMKTASQMCVAPRISYTAPDDAPDRWRPRHITLISPPYYPRCHPHITPISPPHSIIFDVLEAPAFQKYCTQWVFPALYLAVPGCTWLCLCLPSSTFPRPQTATYCWLA